jgi:NAD(P)-dependent dehydrogenase (short-subunit alcohol dehydrogenase family)
MDLQLKGKSALVSGSTAGIGFAIARRLALEGADVVINGRTRQRVDSAVASLRREAPAARVTGVAADLSTPEGAADTLKNVPAVDILVNNLGIFEPRPFAEISDAEWARFFDVNVISGVRLSRAYLPSMLQRNWGRIVFISSESGLQIPKEMIHYGVTKTAQIAVARGLAELTAGTGVTVNSILPGPTKSEGVDEFVGKLSGGKPFAEFEREFFTSVRPTSLLKRFASVDEVAPLVALTCSPLGAAINGAALRVEGGVVKSAF